MSKNLVFLSDGTGNDGDVAGATNVYKLYQRLHNDVPGNQRLSADAARAHLENAAIKQVTAYDPGVGSDRSDLIGKATGKGISDNIKDGYDFLLRFYEPGDRIYLFGFSRGAYTVRSLAGLIGYCGVPHKAGDLKPLMEPAYRKMLVDEAYKIYRDKNGRGPEVRRKQGDAFIDRYGPAEHKDPAARAVYMIGVWDTVRALGIPVYFTDIEVPGHAHRFHDHNLSEHVRYAFHALSIDDERQAFHPVLWNEPTTARMNGGGDRQTFSQVWFPGVHGDVGGGYTDDTGLSDRALAWMIDRMRSAEHPPLLYAPYKDNPKLGLLPNAAGMQHDSRAQRWKKLLYKRMPRSVVRGFQERDSRQVIPDPEDPVARLHASWIERHADDSVIPRYDPLVTRDHPDAAKARLQSRDARRPLPGPFAFVDEWTEPGPG